MIRVDIYTDNGVVSFDDEIESLVWSLKNPEGLPFQVSLPVVSANLLLHTISDSLSDIKRGDLAYVVNAKNEIKLTMNVVLVSVLKDKGVAEIAFEGLALGGNKIGKGVFSIGQNYLDLSVYDDNVRLSPRTQFAKGHAVINNRQDYLLSHLWGGSKLLYIVPTEFTGADKDFKWVEYDIAEGYVPDVEVTPDNLISFDISPAQPPVTGLRTAQRVENEPTSVVSIPDGTQLAKGFFIEGDVKAQAIYVLRMRREGGVPELVASQQLIWADGHVLDLGTTRQFIVGIFTDSYVQAERQLIVDRFEAYNSAVGFIDTFVYDEMLLNIEGVDYYAWTGSISRVVTLDREPGNGDTAWFVEFDIIEGVWKITSSTTIYNVGYGPGPHALLQRKDKYTKEDIGEPVLLNNVDYYFEEPTSFSRMLARPTITTVVNGREVMWFNRVRNEGLGFLKVGLTKDMAVLNADIGAWNAVIFPGTVYRFVSTYCGGDYASAIFVRPLYKDEKRLGYVRIRQTGGSNVIIDFADDLDVTPYLPGEWDIANAVDAFDNYMRGSDESICILFETTSYDGEEGYKTIAINVISNRPPEETGIDYVDVLTGGFQFLDSGDKEVFHYAQAPIIQLKLDRLSAYRESSGPIVLLSNLFDQNVINEMSAIDFLYWFNFGSIYTRYRSNYINAFYLNDQTPEGEEISRVVMIDELVPWAQRKIGERTRVHELSKGVENIIDLPFIVRDLAELDIPVEEKGRIVLDLASFDYTIDGNTETAIVQNLELPALMSFMKVRTSPESNLRIVQVTGADIEYRGAVRLRLQGIIRYEIVPQALTQLSEVLVGKEYWFRQPLDYVDNAIGRFDTPGNYILFRRRRLGNYAIVEETLVGRIVLNRASQTLTVYTHRAGTTYVTYKVISFADYNAGDEIWTFERVKDTTIGQFPVGLEEFVSKIGGYID